MTREEAKEAAKVMLAYAEGKDIEFLKYGNSSWNTISVTKNEVSAFDWHNYDYRIKQESTYRPFKSQEECWNEMLKHQPFGWIKDKNTENAILIGRVFANWIVLAADEPRKFYSLSIAFNNYVFADGTPFGIKED